ncbi:ABC transporter ATP-binding protein [Flavihumibacter fluvii]|uniref:ABC transporter ATP-binding protein n=1 Tax=Flavihumibacter fluvii TaxID=2838157 RepID=UPI001BDE1482|nr:ABC transporter ATP-binding protein [Flavihumibacter fluvii]ULQ54770.1 ABC transporter ATP-binding protein [Flavihumibacter fluvii]
MLSIRHLHKTYRQAAEPSLSGLSIDFEDNIIAGLLGPNGAGKTTTISIICGLVKADEGQVEVMGMDINKDAEAIKKAIGVVPQSIALYPTLTVTENLEYIGKLYGLKNSVIREKIAFYLHLFGLEKSAGKAIRHFSGGMKRRANIIASLLHDPQLLILDEPTAGVDVQSRNMILKFLKEYHQHGHSIMYTSHLLEEAQQLCDVVAIIDHGKLVVKGRPGELMHLHGAASLEQVFLNLTGYSVRD